MVPRIEISASADESIVNAKMLQCHCFDGGEHVVLSSCIDDYKALSYGRVRSLAVSPRWSSAMRGHDTAVA